MKFRFDTPAQRWIEALMVGNGPIGAAIIGGFPTHEIQVNEHTVWEGRHRDRVSPSGLESLPEIRRLLFAGQYVAAQAMVERHLLHPTNHRIQAYQPLCSLLSSFRTDAGESGGVVRELDLATGIHRDVYERWGTRFTCECFASLPRGILVVRYSASKPRDITRVMRLDRQADVLTVAANDNRLDLSGAFPDGGVKFHASAILLADGGAVCARGNSICVAGAETLTVLLAGASSFVAPDDLSGDPAQRCRQLLDAAGGLSYDALREEHVAAFGQQMQRVALQIESEDRSNLTTGQRLTAFSSGPRSLHDESLRSLPPTPPDWSFFSDVFQACRYMLASSSQPGCQPSTLQGRWCGVLAPPWDSDYHPNINLQMNYWLANATGLPECNQPLFDWMKQVAKFGQDTAMGLYGCRGWVLHHVSDIYGSTTPMDGPFGVWPVGGAWLCHHLYEHFQFTRDRRFLADTALPLLVGACEFMLDFLVEAPASTPYAGRLVTAPSHSPENRFFAPDGKEAWICVSAAMDTQIISQLFRDTLAAMRTIGDPAHAALGNRITAALDRLPPMQISPRSGRLMEWLEDFGEPEPGHRHMSHMFGLHPGDTITVRNTPDLAAGARKSIEHRLSHDYHATGWSLPWLAAMFARLGDGDRALEMLTRRLADFTMPNAMYSNAHGHPQVGDACGFAAAMVEMLLQSHQGFIQPLPAMPKQWSAGTVRGLRARGGFEVDMAWQAGALTELRLKSHAGEQAELLLQEVMAGLPADARQQTTPHGVQVSFPTQTGMTYVLRRG